VNFGMLFHGSCWTMGLGSSPSTGVSIAVCTLPLIGPGSHSFSKIVLEGANGAGAPGSATSVIGEEPIHPGSWQFPKLQEVKMNRWSNLLCNIQPDKWWVPATHSNPQLHRKCFPETLWLIRTDGVQHQMPQPQPSAGA
jgi:hypothetical protein